MKPPSAGLYVRESGLADAPTIIFLHGGGLSGRMWLPQLERLPQFHCLAPDLPEHGQSAHVGPFDLRDAAGRIAALIHERALDRRAHLVGLSLGGIVAQAVMAAAPERVGNVILSGTSARLAKALLLLNSLNTLALRFLSPEQMASLLLAQFRTPSEYGPSLQEDLKRFTPQAFAHINRAYAQVEVPHCSPAPTLVAVGERETFVAKRMARQLVAAIPDAIGVIVPGLGHAWNLEAPDLFAATVRAWVEDRQLPGELQPLAP